MKDDSPTGRLAVSLKLQNDPSVGLKEKLVRSETKWKRCTDERPAAPTRRPFPAGCKVGPCKLGKAAWGGVEMDARTLQAAVGATLSIWAPSWPQKGLAPPVEGWLCWIHHVPGLKDRAVTRWGNEGTNFLLGQVPSGPPPWLFLVFVAITKESWIRVGGLSPMNGSSWCACLLLPLNREFAQGQLQL